MKLRVLHIGKFYPPHRGGIESHLQCLCNELRGRVDIQVVVANDAPRTQRDIVDGIPVTRLRSVFDITGASVCPSLVGAIRGAAADLFHIHTPNPVAVLAYLASGRTEPLIITYHSDIVRQKWLGRAFDVMMKIILERSSAIIVSSPNYVESSRLLSRYREKTRVIPFGIPVPPLEARSDEAERIRSHYGRPIILAVGRLVYYKGFEYLIRGMRSVEAQLLIVGDGPLRAGLERTIRECGVGDRVALLGSVEDMAPYYGAADVFVLPSIARSEAFGIVQLEAMASGIPVINTSLASGVPFVSVHGSTGLTVPPADAGALADAMNMLLRRNDLRVEFGRQARLRVETEFSKELMGDKTFGVYEGVLRAKPVAAVSGRAAEQGVLLRPPYSPGTALSGHPGETGINPASFPNA